jgi:hypothetical protein
MGAADPVTICTLASALDANAPPTQWAYVGPWAGMRLGAEVEVWSDEDSVLASAELLGATPKALAAAAISATTFTVADQPTGKLTATSHSYMHGDGPVTLTTTGGLPTGLKLLTSYWIGVFDANTIQLYASLDDAMNKVNPIAVTSNGTGTNRVAVTTTSTNRLRWLGMGKLGYAADGAVTLKYARGYRYAFTHQPRVIAYTIVGTVSSGKVSAEVFPQNPIPV